jgi:poly(hydroxyalkanoate) depolymerase family esterase
MISSKYSIAAATALAMCSLTAHASSTLPNDTWWAAGTNWSYQTNFAGFSGAWVYVPTTFSKKVSGKRGAVIHLKGCGESTFQVAQGSGWPEAAEAFGLVIVVPEIVSPVYPNSQDPNVECYNYGANYTQPDKNTPDHKALIAAVPKLLGDSSLAIDPNQVYIAGLSAGATVAMQVACMAPELFSGVASAAGPGMGSSQDTAIYPPYSNDVQTKCSAYLSASANSSTAATRFKELTIALISDDNDLPAMSFSDQTVWDGDKFCPYKNDTNNETAFAALLGVTRSGTSDVGTGQGIGCSGGEAMKGDQSSSVSVVKCAVKDAKARAWTAHANVFKDSSGKTHLVRIEQDTMRHTWPSGPKGPGDVDVTPTRQDLVSAGYITSDGSFDTTKLKSAPNGEIGVIYFNQLAMDFPMFAAQLWDDNNPRIVPNVVQTPPQVTASATWDAARKKLTVSGTAAATTSGAKIASVAVAFQSARQSANITPATPVPYSVDFPGALADGSYAATTTATVCQASDGCHAVGTCDPKTGCSYPIVADGTSCSDKNACTQDDTCKAGVCSPGAPVTCMAAGECQQGGQCDAFYGCTYLNKKDGTSCSNGGTCTSGKCVAPPAKEPAGPTEHSFMGCGMPGGSFEALAPLLLALIGIRRRR